MIITLTGENDFAIATALRQLVAAFTAKHDAAAIERVSGEQLTLETLPGLIGGATLFAPVRLVIIKDIAAAAKVVQERFAELAEHAVPEVTVVIADSALDKRTKLYKALKAQSDFKEFGVLSEAELATWAVRQAKQAGAELAANDAAVFVRRTGPDQWRLQHEIEKLALHSPIITPESITQLVEAAPQANAFDVLGDSLAGNLPKIGETIQILRRNEDAYKFFGLIASQVFTLVAIHAAGNRAADVVAKQLTLHPFAVRKTQSLVRGLDAQQVSQVAAAVATADLRLKTTGGEPWQIIQNMLVTIAAIKK